jgi:hypothetical protein
MMSYLYTVGGDQVGRRGYVGRKNWGSERRGRNAMIDTR